MTRVYDFEDLDQGWSGDKFQHRRPYIYLPDADILVRGGPGVYHQDLRDAAEEALENMGNTYIMSADFDMMNAVWGSLYQHPEDPARKAHAVHSYGGHKDDPGLMKRLGEITGVPVDEDMDPELYEEEMAPGAGRDFGSGWVLASEDEPPDREPSEPYAWVEQEPSDEWWKKGCPECGHEDLDVHFHGGLSCPECGAEYEDLNGYLVSSRPPEPTGVLWPDTLPWGEEEQDYYRNARVGASWREDEHPRDEEGQFTHKFEEDVHELRVRDSAGRLEFTAYRCQNCGDVAIKLPGADKPECPTCGADDPLEVPEWRRSADKEWAEEMEKRWEENEAEHPLDKGEAEDAADDVRESKTAGRAEQEAARQLGWSPAPPGAQGHERFTWADSSGLVHTVQGSGSHGGERYDRKNRANILKLMRNCMEGLCVHRQRARVPVAAAEATDLDRVPLIRAGEYANFGKAQVYVTETGGGLAEIVNLATGATDVVPVGELSRVGRIVRLSGFYFWSKDIHELAEEQRKQLMESAGKRILEYPFAKDEFKKLLDSIPDQGFKLMPWAAREYKRLLKKTDAIDWEMKQIRQGRDWSPDMSNYQWEALGYNADETRKLSELARDHDKATNDMEQLNGMVGLATKWSEYARTYNIPLPELNSKDFDSDAMWAWVKQMEERESTDPRTWKDSEKIFEFDDGWYIARVGAEDLPKEGKIMQHCVGGSNYQDAVNDGSLTIFSLREPNGEPHATLSMEGDADVRRPGYGERLTFPEVYGKQDAPPESRYQAYIDKWWWDLQKRNWYPVNETEPPEPEDEWREHEEGPFSVDDLADLQELADHVQNEDAQEFLQDEDPWYDEDTNTNIYQEPRALVSFHGHPTTAAPYVALLDEFFATRPSSLDEGTEMVKNLWIMAHVAGDQNYGDFDQVWKRVAWPALRTSLLSQYLRQEPAPQRQDRLFEPGQTRDNPVAAHMIAYGDQLAGASGEWLMSYETTQPSPELPSQPPDMTWQEFRQTWVPRTVQYTRRLYGPQDLAGYLQQAPQAAPPAPGELGAVMSRVSRPTYRRALESLRETGGFSLRANGTAPDPGYYVSVEGTAQVVPLASVTENTIRNFMEEREQRVRERDAFFSGGVNGHGDVRLDVSVAFDSLADAIESARANHQECVWDGYSRSEIPVRVYDEYYPSEQPGR